MRNLTIKRLSSLPGKMISYKVYVEDPTCKNALDISGHKCRYLGMIKDGETKTFEISNEKSRVYVLANKLTKNICNDFCVIPAGHGDIAVSGKTTFNILNFNAFVFNGKPTKEMSTNRKNNKKVGAIILSTILFVGFILGLVIGCLNVKEKTFNCENMSITLTKEFSESNVENYKFFYSNNTISVFGNRETYEEYPIIESFSLKEFADTALSNLHLDDSIELKMRNNYYYFAYEQQNVGGKQNLTYYAMFFEDNEGFWKLTFSCPTDDVNTLENILFTYADSVKLR